MSRAKSQCIRLAGIGVSKAVLEEIATQARTLGFAGYLQVEDNSEFSSPAATHADNEDKRILLISNIEPETLLQGLKPCFDAVVELNDVDKPFFLALRQAVYANGFFFSLTTVSAMRVEVARHLCDALVQQFGADGRIRDNVETALQEAVSNALIHGNLQIGSDNRGSVEGMSKFSVLVNESLENPEFASRRMNVFMRVSANMVEIEVHNEGPGYLIDKGAAPAPDLPYGRGLGIIRAFSGTVSLSDHGRQISMTFPVPSVAGEDGKKTGTTSPKKAKFVSGGEKLSREVLDSRILIVDDDGVALEFIFTYLESAGFTRLETAVDGADALEKAEQFRPDIVVLDIVMPKMDGFEVCSRLRKNPLFVDLPVIVQTGYDKPEDRQKVFASGATDMVVKPIYKMELIARVRIHLENLHLIRNMRMYRERVESELDFARDMQRNLLPTEALIDTVRETYAIDIASYFMPSSELGGDFWGLIEIDEDKLGVYIVDFTGHGVMSALNTFRLHTLLSEMGEIAADPPAFLSVLNDRLVQLLPTGQFATMIYGVIDRSTNKFTYAAAAAPSVLFLRKSEQTPGLLDTSGVLLGISKDGVYESNQIDIAEDDIIFLYSDAFTECLSPNKKALEEEGFSALFSHHKSASDSKSLVKGLVENFLDWAELPLVDDLTAVCVRIMPRR